MISGLEVHNVTWKTPKCRKETACRESRGKGPVENALTAACPRGNQLAPTSKRSPVVVSFDSIKKLKKGSQTAPQIDSFPGTVGKFRLRPNQSN